MSKTTVATTAAVLICLVWLGACSPSQPTEPTEGEGTLIVIADVSAAQTAAVVVEVTAADITTPLVFNLAIVGGTASGTITVPAGQQRTITMSAFSDLGIETHRGSVTLDVEAGTTATVVMTLDALTGDVDISVTLGSISISISPATHTFDEGETVDLTASIAGGPDGAQVTWATLDPGVATVVVFDAVTNIARVTAEGSGTTVIVATFRGTGSSAAVTVN